MNPKKVTGNIRRHNVLKRSTINSINQEHCCFKSWMYWTSAGKFDQWKYKAGTINIRNEDDT